MTLAVWSPPTAPPAPRDAAARRGSRYLPRTRAEGPGQRAALWLQGCDVRCPGCFNPQLWAHRGARLESAAEAGLRFAEEARAAGSEGLTLLGGEPFDQAGAAASIAEAFRARGLTVMTFTGYRLDQLRAWEGDRPDIARLLAATDLLADGPYLRDRPDTRRPWIGSTNQGLHALTDAYRREIAAIEAGEGDRDRLEVRVAADGSIEVNGWADDEALRSLLGDLGVRRDAPSHTAASAPPRKARP
ncbi:4Fe-4S single cluster domain-containing protein [Microbacterium sediminis]|uniref:Radical SAM protein n=1 Tax=Microbacterium sediminis TaxID=904291 RepID=A0A1B9N7V0_9MICO|nr:4Fe-4S single cluster domain-containing protein [Microbacterium sediminis]OCG72686.1 radical SAM protein [Microbacterium sediminis]QBR74801.1 radical SAM protein [Microbacterium sediminis]